MVFCKLAEQIQRRARLPCAAERYRRLKSAGIVARAQDAAERGLSAGGLLFGVHSIPDGSFRSGTAAVVQTSKAQQHERRVRVVISSWSQYKRRFRMRRHGIRSVCDYRGCGRLVVTLYRRRPSLRRQLRRRPAASRRPSRLRVWRMGSRTWASRPAAKGIGVAATARWCRAPTTATLTTIPFQPWARGLHEYRMKTLAKDDPYPACVPHGGPRQFAAAGGFQIVQMHEVQRIYISPAARPAAGASSTWTAGSFPTSPPTNSIPATWGTRSGAGRATRSSSRRPASMKGTGCSAARACRPPKRSA